MYQLCYKKSIIPTVQVDYVPCEIPLDVDEVMKANGVLVRCLKVFNQIKYVEDAYEDFISFKSTVTVSAIASDMTLERKARSFFLEFEIFLDHWKKYMSWRGKKEEFKAVFDQATHSTFENSDQYALASMLRNYIAHNADVIQGKIWGDRIYRLQMGTIRGSHIVTAPGIINTSEALYDHLSRNRLRRFHRHNVCPLHVQALHRHQDYKP